MNLLPWLALLVYYFEDNSDYIHVYFKVIV